MCREADPLRFPRPLLVTAGDPVMETCTVPGMHDKQKSNPTAGAAFAGFPPGQTGSVTVDTPWSLKGVFKVLCSWGGSMLHQTKECWGVLCCCHPLKSMGCNLCEFKPALCSSQLISSALRTGLACAVGAGDSRHPSRRRRSALSCSDKP